MVSAAEAVDQANPKGARSPSDFLRTANEPPRVEDAARLEPAHFANLWHGHRGRTRKGINGNVAAH
jgi:hypothetical protein